MPNQDCLFCKIIAGEIPATKIYENEKVLAFLDINPVNFGHTLIVPKKHFVNMLDADQEYLHEMADVTKKIAQAILNGFDQYSAFNLEMNNGGVAGQIIPHLHWHIVPRSQDDGFKHWPGKKYREGQIETIADNIKNNL